MQIAESEEKVRGNFLRKVVIGDIVLIRATNLNIGGFTAGLYDQRVKLSHYDPNSSRSFSSGDKSFYLTEFQSYETLKKVNQIRTNISNENEREIKNLLEEILIGDFVLLKSKEFNVGGFFLGKFMNDKKQYSVIISHEDPNSTVKHAFWDGKRIIIGKGDRNFLLECFQSYEILKRSLELRNKLMEKAESEDVEQE